MMMILLKKGLVKAMITCDIAGTFEIELEDQYEIVDINRKAVWQQDLVQVTLIKKRF